MFYSDVGFHSYRTTIEAAAHSSEEENFPMSYTTQAFVTYIAYKRTCAAQCTVPVSYAAWMYLRGITHARPW